MSFLVQKIADFVAADGVACGEKWKAGTGIDVLHSHVAAYATLDEIDHCCGERATAVSCDRRGQCVDFVGKINSRAHRDEYTSLHHDAITPAYGGLVGRVLARDAVWLDDDGR